MTITHRDFVLVLRSLSGVLPYAKSLDAIGAMGYWISFPAQAKAELTPEMLHYAMIQRMLDPEPPKEVPLHMQLLRYLYRLENGHPNFRWGLKEDLPERMAQSSQFYPQLTSQNLAEIERSLEEKDATAPFGVLNHIGWGG
jgi:hypothetical protein